MEMSPDSLETGGVNDLSVPDVVDESVTPAQTASASFGTHRERSSNSNTGTVHEKCLEFFGQLCLSERVPQ